jgi:ER lumen protein retaining receptor
MQLPDLRDTKKAMATTFEAQKSSITIWIIFLLASFVVYWLFSSGDFSFLLTFAAFMRCFGFGLLNTKMWGGKTAKGVSVKTLQLYGLTFTCRLISILRHQGYLPFDKSGDWFYHLIEFGSLFSVCFAIYAILGPLISTYDEKYDKFGNLHIPSEFGAAYLIVPCVVMAILFHPSLNKEFLSDTCWTLSMYLEAVAMIPQIYMFQTAASADGGHVEPLIGHTIFALGFARIFELFFWVGSFKELSDHSGGRLPGYIVLLSQLGHMVVMADFFYYYFKSLSAGLPMQLPTAAFGGMEV